MWAKYMLLEHWKLKLRFSEEGADEAAEVVPAATSIKQEYKTCEIVFYPYILQQEHGEMERTIVHELTHCIVSTLVDQCDSLRDGKLVTSRESLEWEERTVEWITQIIYRPGETK